MNVVFVVLVVAGILLLSELLWREEIIEQHNARPFVHIAVGIWAALWPWIISFRQIGYIALAMFAVVVASRALNIFKSIHRAKRWTIGELLFPLGIYLCSILTDSNAVFAAAMLHLGLADGLASVIGSRLRYHGYRVLGQYKSYSGTSTFLLVSFFITLFTLGSLGAGGNFILLIVVPVAAAIAENISVFGLDDLTVPVLTVLLLSTGI